MNMLRILVLTNAYPYGKGVRGMFIKEQTKSLRRLTEGISVVCPVSYFPAFFLRSHRFRDYTGHVEKPQDYSHDGVRVYFPRSLPTPPGLSFTSRIQLTSQGFVALDTIRRNNIQFDVLHAHFLTPMAYVATKIRERIAVPIVLSAHGGDVYNQPYENRTWLKATKKALDLVDMIITPSKRNRDLIVDRFGIPSDRVRIIPNGFDHRLFRPIELSTARRMLGLPLNRRVVLSVGSLTKIKGHKFLIDAMSKVSAVERNVLCIIIGGGPLRGELQRQIVNLGLKDQVVLMEAVNHTELPIWIGACNLFVLPSLDEGTPTVLSEVMACGRPILSTHVGGVPEIMNQECLGRMVEREDAGQLAEELLGMLDMKWDPMSISEHAKRELSWDAISERIMDTYEFALGNARRSS